VIRRLEDTPELKPLGFACEETLGMIPGQIAEQILDISRWSSFRGYAVLPGIGTATAPMADRHPAEESHRPASAADARAQQSRWDVSDGAQTASSLLRR
jgi:hypothetical protein